MIDWRCRGFNETHCPAPDSKRLALTVRGHLEKTDALRNRRVSTPARSVVRRWFAGEESRRMSHSWPRAVSLPMPDNMGTAAQGSRKQNVLVPKISWQVWPAETAGTESALRRRGVSWTLKVNGVGRCSAAQ